MLGSSARHDYNSLSTALDCHSSVRFVTRQTSDESQSNVSYLHPLQNLGVRFDIRIESPSRIIICINSAVPPLTAASLKRVIRTRAGVCVSTVSIVGGCEEDLPDLIRTGSGSMPAGRRKRTGGDSITRHPPGPISTARQPASRDRGKCDRHARRRGGEPPAQRRQIEPELRADRASTSSLQRPASHRCPGNNGVSTKPEIGCCERVSSFSSSVANEISPGEGATAVELMPHEERKLPVLETQIVPGIDKSVLAVAAPRRYRNREHLRSMAGGLRSQLD
jgi:hypothetical protein